MNPRDLPCNSPRRDVQGGKKFVVYQTTNKVNGKIYVGVVQKQAYERGYIGCGVVSQGSADRRSESGIGGFCGAVKKYGYDNFESRILQEFDNEEDAYALEASIVTEEFVQRADTYNLSLGGRLNKPLLKLWDRKDEVVERYADGESLSSIAKDLGVCAQTVRRTLPERVKIRPRNQWILDGKKNIKIRCIETGEVFESIKAAAIRFFGRASGSSSIHAQLTGKCAKSAGHTFCKI
jgi:hypothetical protein